MDRYEAAIQCALGNVMAARDGLIESEAQFTTPEYFGGIRRFQNLSVDTLQELLRLNLCTPSDRQNQAPTLQQFYAFMLKYPDIKAHGYCVHSDRTAYCMTIEGLHMDVDPVHLEDSNFRERFNKYTAAFKRFNKNADRCKVAVRDCDVIKFYSWWD